MSKAYRCDLCKKLFGGSSKHGDMRYLSVRSGSDAAVLVEVYGVVGDQVSMDRTPDLCWQCFVSAVTGALDYIAKDTEGAKRSEGEEDGDSGDDLERLAIVLDQEMKEEEGRIKGAKKLAKKVPGA